MVTSESTAPVAALTGEAGSILGLSFDIALSSLGEPIAAFADFDGKLHLSQWHAGVWSAQVVAEHASSVRVAVDLQNQIHLIYRDDSARRFVHATWIENRLAVDVIDDAQAAGHRPSLVVDETNRVHAAYSYLVNDSWRLRYAYAAPGVPFRVEDVDPVNPDVGPLSLAVSHSTPSIAYSCGGSATLHVATRTNGAWQIQSPSLVSDAGTISLLADAQGLPQIVLQAGYPHPSIEIVRQSASGDWSALPTRAGAHTGEYIAAASIGTRTHIAYQNTSVDENFGLWYAVCDNGTCTATHRGSGGYNVALAVDTSGVAHILHFDDATHELRCESFRP